MENRSSDEWPDRQILLAILQLKVRPIELQSSTSVNQILVTNQWLETAINGLVRSPSSSNRTSGASLAYKEIISRRSAGKLKLKLPT